MTYDCKTLHVHVYTADDVDTTLHSVLPCVCFCYRSSFVSYWNASITYFTAHDIRLCPCFYLILLEFTAGKSYESSDTNHRQSAPFLEIIVQAWLSSCTGLNHFVVFIVEQKACLKFNKNKTEQRKGADSADLCQSWRHDSPQHQLHSAAYFNSRQIILMLKNILGDIHSCPLCWQKATISRTGRDSFVIPLPPCTPLCLFKSAPQCPPTFWSRLGVCVEYCPSP